MSTNQHIEINNNFIRYHNRDILFHYQFIIKQAILGTYQFVVCTDFDLWPSVKLLNLLQCKEERGLLLRGPAINAYLYLPNKKPLIFCRHI